MLALAMRLSAWRIVKLIAASSLALLAAWRWQSSCPVAAAESPALAARRSSLPTTELPHAQSVAEELEREVERLQNFVLERKSQISEKQNELNALKKSAREAVEEKGKSRGVPYAMKSSPSHSSQQYSRMDEVAPVNEYDVVPWSSVTLSEGFHTNIGVGKDTGGKLRADRQAEVDLVLDTALKSLPKAFRRSDFIDGFHRTDRSRGIQYELYFQNPVVPGDVRRVRAVRALEQLSGGRSPAPDSLQRVQAPADGVNVLLPVAGRLKHLSEFLDVFFAKTLLVAPGSSYSKTRRGMPIRLTVIILSSDPAKATAIEELVTARCARVGFDGAHVVKRTAPVFTWRQAMQAAVSAWREAAPSPPSLVYALSVDQRLTADALLRCQQAVAGGDGRVYWPIAFRLYNPRHVYGARAASTPLDKLLSVTGPGGYWDQESYDALCLQRSDFEKSVDHLSTLPSTLSPATTWELETYRFFQRAKSLTVLRAPDQGLFRVYRPTPCVKKAVQNPEDARLAEVALDVCRERKARREGPLKTLSQLAFGSEDNRKKLFAEEAQLLQYMV